MSRESYRATNERKRKNKKGVRNKGKVEKENVDLHGVRVVSTFKSAKSHKKQRTR